MSRRTHLEYRERVFENLAMPRVAAVLGAVALTLSLAACSGTKTDSPASPSAMPSSAVSGSAAPTPSASATPTAAPRPTPSQISTNLDGITVEGKFGERPKVVFTPPFAIKDTTTKVISEGTGAVVADTSTVNINYEGVNAIDGKVFDSSFERKKPMAFALDRVVPGFKKGLTGQKIGSRVLLGVPSQDGYGDQGTPDGAIQKGDTLFFVVDLLDASRSKVEGKLTALPAGSPEVNDQTPPTVKLPDGYAAPKEIKTHVLIAGDSAAKVKATDNISVKYMTVSAKSGKVFESNFGEAKAIEAPLAQASASWKAALVDKTVGSRVVLEVPGDKAYPDGLTSAQIPAGEPLIYVIDILFTQEAQQGN